MVLKLVVIPLLGLIFCISAPASSKSDHPKPLESDKTSLPIDNYVESHVVYVDIAQANYKKMGSITIKRRGKYDNVESLIPILIKESNKKYHDQAFIITNVKIIPFIKPKKNRYLARSCSPKARDNKRRCVSRLKTMTRYIDYVQVTADLLHAQKL
jgi:hypothetical protein